MISVAIMACKEREPYVKELLASLDAPAEVVWDTKRDRWETGSRAVMAYDQAASHHLVIQDDAIVCRDLVTALEKAVKVVPDQPISLFVSHGSNAAHQRINRLVSQIELPTWLEFEGPWWGVAVLFPTKLIPPMMRLANRPRASPAYDKRLSAALVRMKVDCRYILPSLVDHRLDGPSMIEGREQEERHAHHFIGAEASGLSIDWANLPVVDGRRNARLKAPARSTPSAVPPSLRPRPRSDQRPVKVSVAVMAHQSRADFIGSITDKVNAEVVWDRYGDRWETGSRAMAGYGPDDTHRLVIQDDAIVCNDLLQGLHEALQFVPDNPIGLYLGNVRPATQIMAAMVAHATKHARSWVVGEGPLWGVGVCVPTQMIPAMLDWCQKRSDIPNYDRRMGHYFKQAGIDCWYTMPSLVDHRTGQGSLVWKTAPERTARKFIGADASALDVDWSLLPAETTEPYITYTGPGSRRYFLCLSCGFYTTQKHSITRHVKGCAGPLDETETVFKHTRTGQKVRLSATSSTADAYRKRENWTEETVNA